MLTSVSKYGVLLQEMSRSRMLPLEWVGTETCWMRLSSSSNSWKVGSMDVEEEGALKSPHIINL